MLPGDRETARAVVASAPIALPHVDKLNGAAARGGMNETLIADIDADVRKRSAQGIKENEISRLELVCCDGDTDDAHG
ncbi:MAG: hypothetical protein V7640_1476, partial [Betaproteobacteria bacterium]